MSGQCYGSGSLGNKIKGEVVHTCQEVAESSGLLSNFMNLFLYEI